MRKNKRSFSQRGAALVEAAIVTPLFLGMIFGFIEYSQLLRATNSLDNAARNGAIAGRQESDGVPDDFNILTAIKGELATENVSDVKCVVVFKAVDGDNSKQNASCNGPCPVSNVCNTYTASDLANLPSLAQVQANPALFTEGLGWSSASCVNDAEETATPNACRNRIRNGPTDHLGVYIDLKYGSITGMFPVPSSIQRTSVDLLDATTDTPSG